MVPVALGILAKILAGDVIKYLATRALLLTLVTVILPIVLYNVFSTIVTETMEYAVANMQGGSITGAAIQITGIGAWMAQKLLIPQCLSIFLSALSVKWVLSFLRR